MNRSAGRSRFMIRGTVVATAQTDDQGLWRGDSPVQEQPGQTYTAVMSEPGQDDFGAAQTSWNSGVTPWEFGIPWNPSPPEPEMYLYTDRPIYRPGQTVYFRGAVRRAFNGRYELPDFASVRWRCTIPTGVCCEPLTFCSRLMGPSTGSTSSLLKQNRVTTRSTMKKCKPISLSRGRVSQAGDRAGGRFREDRSRMASRSGPSLKRAITLARLPGSWTSSGICTSADLFLSARLPDRRDRARLAVPELGQGGEFRPHVGRMARRSRKRMGR
jgi:hypothetical protein